MAEPFVPPAKRIAINPGLSYDELEQAASRVLEPNFFDFVAGGAGDELTIRANRRSLEHLQLRPRILSDVSSVTSETAILGTPLSAPLFVCPMGSMRGAHQEAEAGIAIGAREAGVGFILSMYSSDPLETVAEVAGEARWFQMYLATRDRGVVRDMIERAAAHGYKGLFVTADSSVPGFRPRAFRHASGFAIGAEHGNLKKYGDKSAIFDGASMFVTPKDIEWLCGISKLPILVKGVMTKEDARVAVDAGARGVLVSNHGGRQLDQSMATIDALPEVVEVVGERAAVLLDGGIRRSTDAAIAMALGATAVGIGRPVVWALALDGSRGVAQVLNNLAEDFARTMALLGATSLDRLSPSHVRRPSRATK